MTDLSIEDEPAFADFLSFLAGGALRHPDRPGDVGDLIAGDDELLVTASTGTGPP